MKPRARIVSAVSILRSNDTETSAEKRRSVFFNPFVSFPMPCCASLISPAVLTISGKKRSTMEKIRTVLGANLPKRAVNFSLVMISEYAESKRLQRKTDLENGKHHRLPIAAKQHIKQRRDQNERQAEFQLRRRAPNAKQAQTVKQGANKAQRRMHGIDINQRDHDNKQKKEKADCGMKF